MECNMPGFPDLHYPWNLLKLMSIESMMPSNYLILCCPLLLLLSIFPNTRVFSNESALCIRWPKYWSFNFSINLSNEYSGGWFPLGFTCCPLLSKGLSNIDKHRQHIQKQRCHFADRSPYSQSYAFSSSHVWMWELDHREGWRIDAFELWWWRRLFRVPWIARRSSQPILKRTNSLFFLEGLTLKLKLQYFGHLTWRANSLKKTLMLGKIEGRRRKE